jgi:hypothetical protein
MLQDYAEIGGVEVWNMARLSAYLKNVGSPFDTGAAVCSCDTLTRAVIDNDPTAPAYDTPATDPAPWYDVDVPDSAKFLGFMPISVDGLDDNPRARTVTNAVGGGGVFGPVRALPRTITVTGLLIGASCCGADYGMHWLTEALAGCADTACGGDCATFYQCCPEATETPAQFNARRRRTLRDVALVAGPTVTDRVGGSSCGGTCGGGEIIQVEFTLVAASPWFWTDPTPVLDVPIPAGGSGDCVDWCVRGSGGAHDCAPSECLFQACVSDSSACSDPLRTPVTPPQPQLPTTSFCIPFAPEVACYTLDLTARPGWSADVPMITINSGSSELRNLRIVFYEKPANASGLTCDEVANTNRCNTAEDFVITYMPANSTITIDGQTGKATLDCRGTCVSASTVYGDQDGGPLNIKDLDGCQYCICLESDNLHVSAPDASVSISVTGRGL